jgi:hypothetical protein
VKPRRIEIAAGKPQQPLPQNNVTTLEQSKVAWLGRPARLNRILWLSTASDPDPLLDRFRDWVSHTFCEQSKITGGQRLGRSSCSWYPDIRLLDAFRSAAFLVPTWPPS